MAKGTKRSMRFCPECNGKLLDYFDKKSCLIESVCWKCGHYESNSEGYRKTPEMFVDMVREEPVYFMKKYATNRQLTRRNTTDKLPEPYINKLIRYWYRTIR